jgi:hypothetical protein
MTPIANPLTVPKVQPLDASQVEGLRKQFIAEVERELIIMGERDDVTAALLKEMREDIVCTPKISAPEVRWPAPSGGALKPDAAAKEIAVLAKERRHLLTFGPDPKELLVARLKELGVPEHEAKQRAEYRIRRLEDGRVAFVDGTKDLTYGPEPTRDAEYTPEALAAIRDPKWALERATRAVLADLETPAPTLRSREEHLASVRNAVRSAI